MKTHTWIIITVSVILVSVATLYLAFFNRTQEISDGNNGTYDTSEPSGETRVQTDLDSLTLEQKVGQLLVISIPPEATREELLALLSAVQPGGIILFGGNIHNETQTMELTSSLNEIAEELGIPPLFIAVDEEGGTVERIPFDPVPYSAAELGTINDERTTRDTASRTAQVLHNLGINTNFAPVADVAYSQDSMMAQRSFGSTPELVSQHVSWTIDEYLKHNIRCTAKHFPGHGRTSTDSHDTLPVIDISKDEWLATDAVPFTSAIASNVTFIMSGHLLYPQIDPYPASISDVWLIDILRNELNFTGIIISDDIKMGAAGSDVPQTAVNALTAGNDMVIAALDQETTLATYETLIARYSDPAFEDGLEGKLLRILSVKLRLSDNVDGTD